MEFGSHNVDDFLKGLEKQPNSLSTDKTSVLPALWLNQKLLWQHAKSRTFRVTARRPQRLNVCWKIMVHLLTMVSHQWGRNCVGRGWNRGSGEELDTILCLLTLPLSHLKFVPGKRWCRSEETHCLRGLWGEKVKYIISPKLFATAAIDGGGVEDRIGLKCLGQAG